MSSANTFQPRIASDGISSMPSLCNSDESRHESSIATNIGAAQLDLTNRYIPLKYSLDRYLEDFRTDVSSEWLMGYTWSNSEEAVSESLLDMGRYLEHSEKILGLGFSYSKNREINSFIPSEGSGQFAVFPARRFIEGENDPWELSTGRKTTQPRRSRKNAVNKPFSRQATSLSNRITISDQTSLRLEMCSTDFFGGSPPSDLLQVGTQFYSAPLPTQLLSFSGEPLPSSPVAPGPFGAINDRQLIKCYTSTTPLSDLVADQNPGNMMTSFPSIEQVNKENATPVFWLKGTSGENRLALPRPLIDATSSSSNGTLSVHMNSKSSSSCLLSNSTRPSIPSLVSGSSSQWNNSTLFAPINDYCMASFSDEFDSIEKVSDQYAADGNRATEEHISEEVQEEFCDDLPNVEIDWNEFFNF